MEQYSFYLEFIIKGKVAVLIGDGKLPDYLHFFCACVGKCFSAGEAKENVKKRGWRGEEKYCFCFRFIFCYQHISKQYCCFSKLLSCMCEASLGKDSEARASAAANLDDFLAFLQLLQFYWAPVCWPFFQPPYL